jgi:hypothetical protein
MHIDDNASSGQSIPEVQRTFGAGIEPTTQASRSLRIDSAVKDLVIGAMRNSVSEVTERFDTTSCTPPPFACTSLCRSTTDDAARVAPWFISLLEYSRHSHASLRA